MKLLLQSDWEAENMTDVVKQAVRQFKWKGDKVEVQYSSWAGIRMMNKNEMVLSQRLIESGVRIHSFLTTTWKSTRFCLKLQYSLFISK